MLSFENRWDPHDLDDENRKLSDITQNSPHPNKALTFSKISKFLDFSNNNQLDQGMSPTSPYLTCFYLVLMLHINILLSFHSRHIFESINFNIEDNVWFRFGGGCI